MSKLDSARRDLDAAFERLEAAIETRARRTEGAVAPAANPANDDAARRIDAAIQRLDSLLSE